MNNLKYKNSTSIAMVDEGSSISGSNATLHNDDIRNSHSSNSSSNSPNSISTKTRRKTRTVSGSSKSKQMLSTTMSTVLNELSRIVRRCMESIFKNQIIHEALPSIILSLVGLVMAGELLDYIQHWPLFHQVPELFILVPILLGLKGNLEMTLAARLSTSANLGHLDPDRLNSLSVTTVFSKFINSCVSFKKGGDGSSTNVGATTATVTVSDARWNILFGNFAIAQIQAIFVGFLSGVWSWILGGLDGGLQKGLLVCACGIISASWSTIILSILMSWMVVVCRSMRADPDNIAIPVAASLGDLVIILMLALCGVGFGQNSSLDSVVTILIIGGSIVSLFFWTRKVKENKALCVVLREGWIPMIISVLLSSLAGVVMERHILDFPTMALLVPVLNGLTGNIASIYASRISTALHQQNEHGNFDVDNLDEVVMDSSRMYQRSRTKSEGVKIGTNPIPLHRVVKEGTNHYDQEMSVVSRGETRMVDISTSASMLHHEQHHHHHHCQAYENIDTREESVDIGLQNSLGLLSTKSIKARNWFAFKTLLFLSVLAGWIFLAFVGMFNLANVQMNQNFVVAYTLVNFVLTLFLLFVAKIMTDYFWHLGLDPDNTSLPFLTAIADVIGTVMVVMALYTLKTYV